MSVRNGLRRHAARINFRQALAATYSHYRKLGLDSMPDLERAMEYRPDSEASMANKAGDEFSMPAAEAMEQIREIYSKMDPSDQVAVRAALRDMGAEADDLDDDMSNDDVASQRAEPPEGLRERGGATPATQNLLSVAARANMEAIGKNSTDSNDKPYATSMYGMKNVGRDMPDKKYPRPLTGRDRKKFGQDANPMINARTNAGYAKRWPNAAKITIWN
jgi:hypothetical protein